MLEAELGKLSIIANSSTDIIKKVDDDVLRQVTINLTSTIEVSEKEKQFWNWK